MAASEERVDRNELIFRMVNERLREIVNPTGALTEFHCECTDDTCRQTVAIDLEEYAALRWLPNTSLIVPGHERPDLDTVVTATDRFLIVEKSAPSPENLEEVITAIHARASATVQDVGESRADRTGKEAGA